MSAVPAEIDDNVPVKGSGLAESLAGRARGAEVSVALPTMGDSMSR